MTTKNDCCYGKFNSRPSCRNCHYRASCKYYSANMISDQPDGNCVSYELVSEWYQETADPSPSPGDEPDDGTDLIGIDKLAEFFRYLLNLDKYTLEILKLFISNDSTSGSVCSISEIARKRGCSRQAVHHKVLDIIRRHPELSQLFSLTLRHLPRDRRRYAAV